MPRSEIDDIFAAKRPREKTNTSSSQPRPQPRPQLQPQPQARKRPRRVKDAPRRKTAEGYNIYKEDELGMSTAGGDTPLCPFDCQCCF